MNGGLAEGNPIRGGQAQAQAHITKSRELIMGKLFSANMKKETQSLSGLIVWPAK